MSSPQGQIMPCTYLWCYHAGWRITFFLFFLFFASSTSYGVFIVPLFGMRSTSEVAPAAKKSLLPWIMQISAVLHRLTLLLLRGWNLLKLQEGSNNTLLTLLATRSFYCLLFCYSLAISLSKDSTGSKWIYKAGLARLQLIRVMLEESIPMGTM